MICPLSSITSPVDEHEKLEAILAFHSAVLPSVPVCGGHGFIFGLSWALLFDFNTYSCKGKETFQNGGWPLERSYLKRAGKMNCSSDAKRIFLLWCPQVLSYWAFILSSLFLSGLFKKRGAAAIQAFQNSSHLRCQRKEWRGVFFLFFFYLYRG